jgi:hypothetical protein
MTYVEEADEASLARCWPTIEQHIPLLFVTENILCKVEIWDLKPGSDHQADSQHDHDETPQCVTRLASTTEEMDNALKVGCRVRTLPTAFLML